MRFRAFDSGWLGLVSRLGFILIEAEDAAVDRLEGVADCVGVFLGPRGLRGGAAAKHQGPRHKGRLDGRVHRRSHCFWFFPAIVGAERPTKVR